VTEGHEDLRLMAILFTDIRGGDPGAFADLGALKFVTEVLAQPD